MGTNEGTIEQWSYEDESIKMVKFHPKVQNFGSLRTKIVHLKWVSSFVFAIVYSVQTESGSYEQILVLKHSKKGEPPLYVNFNDIYNQSENSETFYFSELFIQQKILITTTGLANEVVVLANHGNATNPMEWFSAILDETSRAELPLYGVEESYPMGLAIDTSSQSVIPSDTSPTPPHPILLLLTTKGVLCPFHMIYKGMSELVEPPRVLKSAKQPTNPQAVTKNLSTTTVTVIGYNCEKYHLYNNREISRTNTTVKPTEHYNVTIFYTECISSYCYSLYRTTTTTTTYSLYRTTTTTSFFRTISSSCPGTTKSSCSRETTTTTSPSIGQQQQQQPPSLGQQQQLNLSGQQQTQPQISPQTNLSLWDNNNNNNNNLLPLWDNNNNLLPL